MKASTNAAVAKEHMNAFLGNEPYEYKVVTTQPVDGAFKVPVVEIVTWYYPFPMITSEFERMLSENFINLQRASKLRQSTKEVRPADGAWTKW
jgi:hypothetical protein